MTALKQSVLRRNAARETVPRATGCRMSVPAATVLKESVPRETEIRQTDPEETGARMTALRESVLRESVFRETVPRAEEIRVTAAARTERQGRGVTRETAHRADIHRADTPVELQTAVITVTAAAATTAAMAALTAARAQARETDRTEDSSSQEEAADRMADLRETDKVDFREAAGRVLWALQAIAAVRALARVLGGISMAARATAEALEDREVDSAIINRVKALPERLRERIWRRSARKKRDGLTARKKASAPRKTISMRRMMQPGRNPADSSSLRRRKRKWQRRSSR